jgi:hypothetical protein
VRHPGSHPVAVQNTRVSAGFRLKVRRVRRGANPESRPVAGEISPCAPRYPFRARKDPDFNDLAAVSSKGRRFGGPLAYRDQLSNRPWAPAQNSPPGGGPVGLSRHTLQASCKTTSCGAQCQGPQHRALGGSAASRDHRGKVRPEMTFSCVTVFGGSGFLGRRIVERLADDGAVVRVAVRHPEGSSRKSSSAVFPRATGPAMRRPFIPRTCACVVPAEV